MSHTRGPRASSLLTTPSCWFLFVLVCVRCWSYIGRQTRGQAVSLRAQGCLYTGTVQHEVLHALGFHHEQARSDRDSYITILTQNIQPGQHPPATLSVPLRAPRNKNPPTWSHGREKPLSDLLSFAGKLSNFAKVPTNNLGTPYDYTSVMHYSK